MDTEKQEQDSVEQARLWKEYYTSTLYSKARLEQRTDRQYINDSFVVEEVKAPHKVYRSGLGRKMVDAPAEQIVTSNPQAFMKTGNEDLSIRLGKEANRQLNLLRFQNPNPFKQSVKNKLSKGESIIHLVHNQRWVTHPIKREGLPVLFLQPDPLVVYCSMEDDDSGWFPRMGVPNRVILFYQRALQDVISHYPSWTNPKNKSINTNPSVDWLEYWDKNTQIILLDNEILVNRENPYKFTPFVRKYSGFGDTSEDGDLVDLLMTDIRFSRDLLHEECVLRSNIASINNIFAHKSRTIMSRGELNARNLKENLGFGEYDLNVLDNLPAGTEFLKEEAQPATLEMEQHLRDIRSELNQRCPFIMAGFPVGETGRQQSLAEASGRKRYDTVVENTEQEFATAMEMAFAMCKSIPTLSPDGLHKGVLDKKFTCGIRLKAKDPIEEDRLSVQGNRMQAEGVIDPKTNLTQYQGYTEDEADEILGRMLAYRVTIYNPDIAEVLGRQAAEELGMEDEMAAIKAQQVEGVMPTPTASGMERTMGEAQSIQGQMEAPVNKGVRFPPEQYARAG